ncbi:hypothetical protein EXIGLDRAFT_261628 [Exidia glandulosa HHB12029]|uniref:Uncharacterized protein n=1 Tax=Exidia glandulosa HHB12029 TaxID=1314781 RepID=A0A165DTL4_EXIGL|nr:hypothetical protein EXIGLDRAFT_261628 [Exidia glandulosa HHB12029]
MVAHPVIASFLWAYISRNPRKATLVWIVVCARLCIGTRIRPLVPADVPVIIWRLGVARAAPHIDTSTDPAQAKLVLDVSASQSTLPAEKSDAPSTNRTHLS